MKKTEQLAEKVSQLAKELELICSQISSAREMSRAGRIKNDLMKLSRNLKRL